MDCAICKSTTNVYRYAFHPKVDVSHTKLGAVLTTKTTYSGETKELTLCDKCIKKAKLKGLWWGLIVTGISILIPTIAFFLAENQNLAIGLSVFCFIGLIVGLGLIQRTFLISKERAGDQLAGNWFYMKRVTTLDKIDSFVTRAEFRKLSKNI